MAEIWSFPITTPYGWVKGYPLNQTDPIGHPGMGYHNGIDYGAPTGTDITVNGVVIGISGYTGAVSPAGPQGAHCHVGHWGPNGVITIRPLEGRVVSGGVVTQIGQDAVNGKFVRVGCPDGTSYVYLHMSDNNKVKVGQKLQGSLGNSMYPNKGDLINIYNSTGWPGHLPNGNDIAYWTLGTGNPNWGKGADATQKALLYEIINYVNAHPKTSTPSVTKLNPGLYQV